MPSPELVGRALELQRLDEVVRSGGSAVVSGPAGIGKSSPPARGRAVCTGPRDDRAHDDGRSVRDTSAVRRAPPAPPSDPGRRRSAARGTARLRCGRRSAYRRGDARCLPRRPGPLNLLTDAAGEAGLVAIAEDAQWLDHGSGAVLAFVARRLGSHRVSLLVGIRSGFREPAQRCGHHGDPRSTASRMTSRARSSTRSRRSCRRPCESVSSRRRTGTRWRSWSYRPRSRPNSSPGPSRFPTSSRSTTAWSARSRRARTSFQRLRTITAAHRRAERLRRRRRGARRIGRDRRRGGRPSRRSSSRRPRD